MANAASTPEFKAIMRRLAHEGKRGGPLMKASWAEYKRRHHGKTTAKRNPRKRRPKPTCKYCGTQSVLHGGVCLHCLKQNPGKELTGNVKKDLVILKSSLAKYRRAFNVKNDGVTKAYERSIEHLKLKKNPIAIYNPAHGKPLPMSIIEIRYKRTGGEHSGQLFKHRFKNRPRVYGLPDGSLRIIGSQKLWGTAD